MAIASRLVVPAELNKVRIASAVAHRSVSAILMMMGFLLVKTMLPALQNEASIYALVGQRLSAHNIKFSSAICERVGLTRQKNLKTAQVHQWLISAGRSFQAFRSIVTTVVHISADFFKCKLVFFVR